MLLNLVPSGLRALCSAGSAPLTSCRGRCSQCQAGRTTLLQVHPHSVEGAVLSPSLLIYLLTPVFGRSLMGPERF